MVRLRDVFECLRKARVKCTYMKTQAKYFERIITNEGLILKPAALIKLKKKFKCPRTQLYYPFLLVLLLPLTSPWKRMPWIAYWKIQLPSSECISRGIVWRDNENFSRRYCAFISNNANFFQSFLTHIRAPYASWDSPSTTGMECQTNCTTNVL